MERELADKVVETAFAAGANTVGITVSEPFAEARTALEANLANGLSGPLRFTYGDPATATDISRTYPWAKALVSVGRTYVDESPPPHTRGPIVARFATDDHYVPVRDALGAVARTVESHGFKAAALIDDNRMVDRAVAIRSGAGWRGRNTMVLTPAAGPWMLLGTLATDAELAPTSPMNRSCGTCTACIPACPTGALSGAGLDARRCISTWLQSPGPIPHWIRPAVGRRIYGCDDCLTSCPPGHKAMAKVTLPVRTLSFSGLLSLSDAELVSRFEWWYIPRRDGRYLRRNLLIAAGNSREPEARGSIEEHLSHRSSLIRGTAAWALARCSGGEASERLAEMSGRERAPEARKELELAMLMIEDPAAYADEVGSGPR